MTLSLPHVHGTFLLRSVPCSVSFIFPMSLNLTIFLAFSYRFRVPHNVLNNNCHLTCWFSIYHEESRRLSAKTDAVWTGARRCGQGPGSMGGGQAVWTGAERCGWGPSGVDGGQALCPDTRADIVPDPTGWWPQ